MRLILAMIVAVANAAGPWLCCCAVMAMIAPRSSTAFASSESLPPQQLETCGNCCHQPAPEPVDSVPERSKTPTQAPCPCQEHLIAIPIVPAETTETLHLISNVTFDYYVAKEIVIVPLVDQPDTSQLRPLPFLTAQERQRVHHVMHC